MRPLLLLAIVLTACGSLSPPGTDGGSGGGTANTGGGTANTGGGTASTGGGNATGGGAATGGGSATGGGNASGGGGGTTVLPLSWASMSISGVTGTGPILALSGVHNDVWAIQDNGNLYHSTGGAFALVTQFSGGVKGLHVVGNLIVVLQYRAIRWCSSNCTTPTAFDTIDLVSPGLDAEAACGKDASTIAVIVSDTSSMAQLYEWNGTTFMRTNQNLGVRYPRACWYDAAGGLNVAGEDKIINYANGAASPQVITTTGTTYFGGYDAAGTGWTAGQNGTVAKRVGSSWSKLTTTSTNTLYAVGGPRSDEIFMFGLFQSNVGNGYRWNGTSLVPTGELLPSSGSQSVFRHLLVTSPDELFVGGSNQAGPVIVRGSR